MILAYVRPIVGNCQQPFSGPNCKRRNIAYRLQNLPDKPQILGFSSSYTGTSGTTFWPAGAVDGHLNTTFITNVEQNPYLWVNLKSNYTLHKMTLYTDANSPSDLNGFKIEVAYSSDFQSPSLCYQDQSSQGRRVHLINCTQPIEGQYVRIQIPTTPNNPRSLIVHEFDIYQCEDGYYGPDCTPCGQCQNGAKCDNTNGECPVGCRLGFAGMLCINECDDGTYGQGCKMTCGKCANNAVCDKEDGTCPAGCSPRFTGQRCDECAEGYRGIYCEKSSSESPDCCLCDDTIDKTCKSPTGYIVGLCIAIVLCIIATALMVMFYFQKQRYLKLYMALDATRYASFQNNPVVDASEVVYLEPIS